VLATVVGVSVEPPPPPQAVISAASAASMPAVASLGGRGAAFIMIRLLSTLAFRVVRGAPK
jgi:hypothetical protein